MTFACAHAGFTKAANHPTSGYIGTGTVFSDVQTSRFVRSVTDTQCNGFTFAPNVLRDSDIGNFGRKMPERLKARILKETETQAVIVYRFFHYRDSIWIEHGWIVTTTRHGFINQAVTGPTWKSADVIAQCRKEVCRSEDVQAAA